MSTRTEYDEDLNRSNITIALVGNANVGKSTLFNQLTGLHQHIGNWPGKTVEKKEGTLCYENYKIDVIDLPGIYSLSTFSIEELIAREYIVSNRPDVIVNVVDSSSLERNLFLTLQLIEMQVPMVLALNMVDVAERKGITINEVKLSEILGIPVIKMVVSKGIGVKELVDTIIQIASKKIKAIPNRIEYGRDIEERISKIIEVIKDRELPYPKRFVAIKLLENDEEIKKLVDSNVLDVATKLANELSEVRGYAAPIVIASERYATISKIVNEVQEVVAPQRLSLAERLDAILMHKYLGYPVMVGTVLSMFYAIFTIGSMLSDAIAGVLEGIAEYLSTMLHPLLLEGIWGGFVAGLTLLLPYVIPFYILLAVLEDSGYLPRIAFLLDNIMHKIGLHGKAIIPILMGYGCNVPACYACRIMETERERLITAFVVTFIPCTARLVVIYGLVATYVGIQWAYAFLAMSFGIALLMGKLAYKTCKGESYGLIMEMPTLKAPSAKVVIVETLIRVKSIIYVVFPVYILGGLAIALLQLYGVLNPIELLFEPLMKDWLGLPSFTIMLLIFGFIRKEMVLILPAIQFGVTDLNIIFSPIQMLVLTFIAIFYAPCAATFVMLKREFSLRVAIYITLVQIGFALLFGGILYRILDVYL